MAITFAPLPGGYGHLARNPDARGVIEFLPGAFWEFCRISPIRHCWRASTTLASRLSLCQYASVSTIRQSPTN